MGGFFDYRVYHSWIILVILTVLSFCLSVYLPPELIRENGPIENVQVLVLFGALLLIVAVMKRQVKVSARNLWGCMIPVILLLIGRELSWGRVFYPTGNYDEFAALKDLWYGKFVIPLIALIIIGVLITLWRNHFWQYLQTCGVPFWLLVLLVVLCVVAQLSETHHLQHIMANAGASLEEIAELLAYLTFADMLWIVGFK